MNIELQQWACSLSGCDGGNLDADTWLCGIEWGGASYGTYYEVDLPEEISKGAITKFDNKFDWVKSITYPYGISFAKLYTAINGGNVAEYSNVKNLTGNELCKTNLYPIAFDSTDSNLWHKNKLDEITGFENKHLFNTWCFFNRFSTFAALRNNHKPKLIVCTGIDYLREFVMFFSGNEKIGKINSGKIFEESESNGHVRTYYWLKLSHNTLLVVIPFFSGKYGLNSNYLLQEMGRTISNLQSENF